MNKTFLYRVRANNVTITKAEAWLNLCCDLYNACLEQRITAYKSHHRSVSKFEQMRQVTELRAVSQEYRNIDAQMLEDVVKRLNHAYDAFFRRVKSGGKPGFPRFKGQARYDSFTLRQTGWKLDGKYLIIKRLGIFKLRLSRLIQGTIKTVTISRNNGKWYAAFSCEDVPAKPLPKTDTIIGIDMGLENFATLSDGSVIENPRYYKHGHDVLKRRQQALSRKIKGSKRRNKACILVAKAHDKISNQRKDFHYKTAVSLLNQYGTICIEDLKAWRGYRTLNKSMRDAAWFGFFEILTVKAEEAGREVIRVPARGTSQTCSGCGTKVSKDLSVRVHSCPNCNLVLHRDHNAALNILRAGQALQSPPAPCG